MPRRKAAAKWFAKYWRQFATAESKLHIRRIRYRLISSKRPLLRPNGEPYLNTEASWDWLINAGRDARYLDLIPFGSIVDRRNPEPAIFLVDAEDAAINIAGGLDDLVVPGFTPPQLHLVKPSIAHRYLVEVWCEKSTVNDILMPLGEEYSVNVVTGLGEMSATRVEQLIDRIRRSRRPVRILYISDFDPSSENMPVSVARKIEFPIRYGEWFDVQVRHVVLTHEQCIAYRLPRTPIREGDGRAEKWATRYGEGATELDALEALRPGELRRLLVEEIERYRDDTLDERIADVAAAVQSDLNDVNNAVGKRHAKGLAMAIAASACDHVQQSMSKPEVPAAGRDMVTVTRAPEVTRGSTKRRGAKSSRHHGARK